MLIILFYTEYPQCIRSLHCNNELAEDFIAAASSLFTKLGATERYNLRIAAAQLRICIQKFSYIYNVCIH